jgi:hypothetical protein
VGLQQLLDALRPYQHLDPDAWVHVVGSMPVWLAMGLVGLGWYLLAAHGTRIAGALLAGVAGLTWVPHVLNEFGLMSHERLSAAMSLLVLGTLAFFFRPTAAFLIWGIPAGLLAGAWVGSLDYPAAFLPAFLLVGLAAAMFFKESQAVAGAMLGGWLAVMGAARLLGLSPAKSSQMTVMPLLEAAGTAALLSLTFHLSWRGARERWRLLTAYRSAKQARAQDRKALEERWRKR